MLIPIRCYAVIAGTHAADPLAGEVLRMKDRAAADAIAAAIQAHARRGSVFGPAQYFVREVDDDLDLPVASAAEAVAQGYTIRATSADSPMVVGPAGVTTDQVAVARVAAELAAAELGTVEGEEPQPIREIGAIVRGDEVLAP